MLQINWKKLKSDEQIINKLKELMQEIHISSPEMQGKSREEMMKMIKDYIAGKGFPAPVDVSISEPNEIGHRMFLGETRSPLTGIDINF